MFINLNNSQKYINKLTSIKNQNGNIILTQLQANQLASIRYVDDNQPVVSMSTTYLNYQLQAWLEQYSFEEVYEWLVEVGQAGSKLDPVMDSPWVKQERTSVLRSDERFLIQDQVEEAADPCPRCSSKQVVSRELRTRSADEPISFAMRCVTCSNTWRIG